MLKSISDESGKMTVFGSAAYIGSLISQPELYKLLLIREQLKVRPLRSIALDILHAFPNKWRFSFYHIAFPGFVFCEHDC